jgi:hypothetical protein
VVGNLDSTHPSQWPTAVTSRDVPFGFHQVHHSGTCDILALANAIKKTHVRKRHFGNIILVESQH